MQEFILVGKLCVLPDGLERGKLMRVEVWELTQRHIKAFNPIHVLGASRCCPRWAATACTFFHLKGQREEFLGHLLKLLQKGHGNPMVYQTKKTPILASFVQLALVMV